MPRLHLLCEDRRTERFVRALCKRFCLRVEDVRIAPDAQGAADHWVLKNYPAFVRKARSVPNQREIYYLVVIDGDGPRDLPASTRVAKRNRQLAQALQGAELSTRAAQERIAHFVPTWSIETWLAHFCAANGVTESEPLKDDRNFRGLWNHHDDERRTIVSAAGKWDPKSVSPLASLDAAYREAPRAGLA